MRQKPEGGGGEGEQGCFEGLCGHKNAAMCDVKLSLTHTDRHTHTGTHEVRAKDVGLRLKGRTSAGKFTLNIQKSCVTPLYAAFQKICV